MFGVLLGTACLVGLLGVSRCGPRRGCGHHRGHGPDHHGHHRGRRRQRRGIPRAFGEKFKRRMDVDEDQADLIDHAFADLRGAFTDLKDVVADSRSDLADALRGESVDEATLDALFDRHDEALKQARRRSVSALKQIHAVLDPPQRDRAADWIGDLGQHGGHA